MKCKFIIVIGIIGIFSIPAWALATEKKSPCTPNSYGELVRCALGNSLEIQIAGRQNRAAMALEATARQWQNPELDVESVRKSGDSETSASLLFDISLGGKRSAGIDIAMAEVGKSQAQLELSAGQKKLELILAFYQLAHLEDEIKIEEESVATFTKIVSQFSKKPALSPEQQVSLAVFKMAVSDHEFRLVKLQSTEGEILQGLVSSTGIPKEIILKNLPMHKSSWPQIKTGINSEHSPQLRLAQSEVLVAKGQYSLAKAESWPELRIGPAIKTQKEGAMRDNFFGVALSLPIPILSWNGGGRSYGEQRLQQADLSLELAKRQNSALRDRLTKKYQSIVAAMKNAISEKSLDEKHEQLERLFFKGLVPSSLVIEAHRQLIELEQNKNSAERDALQALGEIYIIDNEFSEVIL